MPLPDSMTIVHVSTQRQWYGGEEQARLLAEGQRARGHRCVVFARQDGAFGRRMRAAGFEIRDFLGNGRHPGAIWRLRRELGRIAPDVIHFHDAHALTTGGVAAYGLPIRARIAARRCDYATRSPHKYRRLCDRVVAVSDAVAGVCVDSGIPAGSVRVVHDGVDPARARAGDRRRGRTALGLGADERLVLNIASLTPAKGHADLLGAMPEVLVRHPRIRLAFAGDGELRDPLFQQASRLGIADRVIFLGYRHDIPDLLHAADLFVMSSRHEALGSSLIDAMLSRLPIVATSSGGIPELVGAHEREPAVAMMVPPRNPGALGGAMLQALNGWRAPVREAEDRALGRFTMDHMVERTLDVYEELLA